MVGGGLHLRKSSHIYFPVLKSDNTVAGVLSAKDFFMNSDPSYLKLVRPACKVTPADKASQVLVRFQESLTNFSVVVRDNNELIGIVTIHDIGEILIGKFG
jgi:CBS domain containing-hemolysin-like protein